MQLACSSNAFVRQSLAEALAAIAAIGYRAVEILADRPHLFPLDWVPGELRGLAGELERRGLAVASLNANTACGYYPVTFWEPVFEPSLANPEPAARRWRIDCTRRAVDLAHTLGAPLVTVTSGRLVPGIDRPAALALLADSLHEVLAHASAAGVRIGIEYEPGLLVESAADLLLLLAQLDSPWLGANLDLGHSHVAGEEPEPVITALAGRIFGVHLEDIAGRRHQHLVPGDGDLDFDRLGRAQAAA
ncbi:MAG: sugar phosphate isomerase/epimerase family protein, partial [Thermodesulfobacteriota bacterium]